MDVVTEPVQGAVASSAAEAAPQDRPILSPLREVRLAVVMYGGVSLCIYMNGVAQELLHLVRATAPDGPDDGTLLQPALPLKDLDSSEPAYRKLAQTFGDGATGSPDADEALDTAPILVRYVVDILSGSSAGGINAVFLSKALANDQAMDGLTKLWLDEGDIDKLLNDGKSAMRGVPRERPPQSLLSSQRMYVKLLEAFRAMEESNGTAGTQPRRSPYVRELDLFVTTTDLNGVLLPIRFANGVTEERRYRNVFHFRYGPDDPQPRYDFRWDVDPFLAFACRCTSAFPIAFTPMLLDDVDDLIPSVPTYAGLRAGEVGWRRFYPDYPPASPPSPENNMPFAQRPFADGGALDNKPFGYAIDTLIRRRAQVPVDRKLFFVEPDPDRTTIARDPSGRPNVFQNFLAQSALLPRQETVRDDLRRIDDFNRLVRRTDYMVSRIDGQLMEQVMLASAEPGTIEIEPVGGLQLDRWMGDDGLEPAGDVDGRLPPGPKTGYRWLRAEATVEDLTGYLCELVPVDPESDYGAAIRVLVRAWRERNFVDPPAEGRRAFPWFMKAFDLAYRLRRLTFLTRRLDTIYALDDDAYAMLSRAGIDRPDALVAGRTEEFRTAIRRMKGAIEAGFGLLERAASPPSLMPGAQEPPPIVRVLAAATGIDAGRLATIYEKRSDGERIAAANDLLDARVGPTDPAIVGERVGDLMARIETDRRAAMDGARDAIEHERAAVAAEGSAGEVVADFVAVNYLLFEEFDAVAFPLQYGSGTGEGDEVEVIRVSPLDADSLTPTDGRKVTGARVRHFGAFLDRLWRENDMMWGRLDAAEILIESLAPTAVPDRDVTSEEALAQRSDRVRAIRDEALCAILREELQRKDLATLVWACEHVNDCGPMDDRTTALLNTVSRCPELLAEFRANYRSPELLDPTSSFKNVGRAAHVLGQMSREVALGTPAAKLAPAFAAAGRLGQLFTGLVEAAVPGSFAHLLAFHWFVVLYLFEILAIVGGALFHSPAIGQFGLTAFLATLGVNVVIWLITRKIRSPGATGRSRLVGLAAILVTLLLIATIVLAVLELRHLGSTHAWIPIFGRTPAASPSP